MINKKLKHTSYIVDDTGLTCIKLPDGNIYYTNNMSIEESYDYIVNELCCTLMLIDILDSSKSELIKFMPLKDRIQFFVEYMKEHNPENYKLLINTFKENEAKKYEKTK